MKKSFRIKQLKIFALVVGVLALLVSAIAFVWYTSKTKEQAQQRTTEEIFALAKNEIATNEETFETIYEYVISHAPYKTTSIDQDMYQKVVRDTIRDFLFKEHDNADDGSHDDVDNLVYLVWQFEEALLNQSLDDLLSVFTYSAYDDFIYSFDDANVMQNELDNLIKKLTRDGTFQSLSYQHDEDSTRGNEVDLTLFYSDGKKKKLTLLTAWVKDPHHHGSNDARSEIQMFASTFDTILENF